MEKPMSADNTHRLSKNPQLSRKGFFIMNRNTKHTNPSSVISTSVYDLETLKSECEAIGIETTRPNLRRMRRAIDLHQHGCVKPSRASGIYTVESQTEPDTFYVVIDENGCNCPDAKRMDVEFDPQPPHTLGGFLRHRDSMIRCKHEIAVMLYKEQLADQAKYDQWLCEQYEAEQASIDDSLAHSDPVDFRY